MKSYEHTQIDFLEQCSIGDVWKVESLLKSGNINVQYHHAMNGWTGLHWAARRAHEEICLILLKYGFSRDATDRQGKTPYDVCPKGSVILREILKPLESEDNEDAHEMPLASGSRRSSDSSDKGESPRFVPSYIKNPPFPYVAKTNSFDSPASPATPTKTSNDSYYSYGRRDSASKTRFLLVRTSFGDGKEAYKRITLPGGSTIDQLKRTIETAMKNRGRVEAILTLPDKVLIEEDSQICTFSDCQKIDVIFNDKEPSPHPIGDLSSRNKSVESSSDTTSSSLSTTSSMEDHGITEPELKKQIVSPLTAPEFGSDVEVPSNTSEEKEATPAEDLTPFTQSTDMEEGDTTEEPPKSPSPEPEDEDTVSETIPFPAVPSIRDEEEDVEGDLEVDEQSAGDHGDQQVQEGVTEEEVKDSLAVRKSLDSDPGDYVKVEREDAVVNNGNSNADSVIPADMSIIPPAEAEAQPAVPVPAKKAAAVVEESKTDEDGEHQGALAKWIEQNPTTIRNVATAAAVFGVAGLGCLIYTRKMK